MNTNNQLVWQSTFCLLKPTFILSSTCFCHVFSVSLSSFDLRPQTMMPISRHTIFPTQLMAMPMNTVCHGQLIYCFIQIQHQHQVLSSFPIFVMYYTYCSHHGSLFLPEISILLSFTLHTHSELLTLHSCCKQNLSTLDKIFSPCSNFPHLLNIAHQHLVVAVTAILHIPPALSVT